MNGSLLLAAALVLKGATVHTAAGPAVANGVVVMEDGRIVAAGGAETAVPAGATVVDLAGKHVTPALVASDSLLGLMEIQAVRATVDVSEIGDINPEARPDVAMNLDSELLPVTRSAGVLYAVLTPRGSVLPGSAAVMTLDGWTREDACVRCPAAVVVEWPGMLIDRRPEARPSAKRQEKNRDEAIERLRAAFRDAAAYRKAKAAGKEAAPSDDVAAMAALQPALEGKIPILVRANTKRQIEAVLRWFDEDFAGTPVRLALVGGDDAPEVAERLAARRIGVVLPDVLSLPRRTDEPYDGPFAAAGRLAKAGVLVAIGAGDQPGHTRDLRNHAAMSAAFGLDRTEALRTITLNPAKIFGVDDAIGSLEKGKAASIAVWDGDPLEMRSRVVGLYRDGVALDLSDRHKRLWERYRNRPRPGGAAASK